MEIDQPSDHCGNMAEQLEDMRRQLHDLRANAQAPIQPPLNIVVQRERRLRCFDGKVDVDAAAWCADAESALRVMPLASVLTYRSCCARFMSVGSMKTNL